VAQENPVYQLFGAISQGIKELSGVLLGVGVKLMSWCKDCPKNLTCMEDPRGCEIAEDIQEKKKKEFYNSDWGSPHGIL